MLVKVKVKTLLKTFNQITNAVFYFRFCLNQSVLNLKNNLSHHPNPNTDETKQIELLEQLVNNYQLATLLNFEEQDESYKNSILEDIQSLREEIEHDPENLLTKIEILYRLQRALHRILLDYQKKTNPETDWTTCDIDFPDDNLTLLNAFYQDFCRTNKINPIISEDPLEQVSDIYIKIRGQCSPLTGFEQAYHALIELIDTEKSFVTKCRSLNVEDLKTAITKYTAWKNEQADKLDPTITGPVTRVLPELDAYLTLENHLKFTLSQAIRCAHDISIFVHEIFSIICGLPFSQFYNVTLSRLVNAFDTLNPILVMIKNDQQYQVNKNSTEEELKEKKITNREQRIQELTLLLDAPNILSQPYQRVSRYRLTFNAVAENFNKLRELKLPFPDYILPSSNEKKAFPISPSVPLAAYREQSIVPFGHLFTLIDERLSERAKQIDSNIGRSKPPRSVLFISDPFADEFSKSVSVFALDNNVSALRKLETSEAKYPTLESLADKLSRPVSADYERRENEKSLGILVECYPKKQFYKGMLRRWINNTYITPEEKIAQLNRLPIRMRVRWIVETMIHGINPTQPMPWRTGMAEGDYPQHFRPMIELLNNHQKLKLSKEDLMRKLVEKGKLARDYKPFQLNLFYERFPETQHFYDILAGLSDQEPENPIQKISFEMGSQPHVHLTQSYAT